MCCDGAWGAYRGVPWAILEGLPQARADWILGYNLYTFGLGLVVAFGGECVSAGNTGFVYGDGYAVCFCGWVDGGGEVDVVFGFAYEVSAGDDMSGVVFVSDVVPFVVDAEGVGPVDDFDGWGLEGFGHHFSLLAHQAADILPLAILAACRAFQLMRRSIWSAVSPRRRGEPLTPCSPNLMSFFWLPCLATTACDLVGWFGVRTAWL